MQLSSSLTAWPLPRHQHHPEAHLQLPTAGPEQENHHVQLSGGSGTAPARPWLPRRNAPGVDAAGPVLHHGCASAGLDSICAKKATQEGPIGQGKSKQSFLQLWLPVYLEWLSEVGTQPRSYTNFCLPCLQAVPADEPSRDAQPDSKVQAEPPNADQAMHLIKWRRSVYPKDFTGELVDRWGTLLPWTTDA